MKKQEKEITLIALIITIVVLLILAVVSIKAVQDGGIITYAQNAASKMNKAQIEEKANLTKLEFTTDCYTNKDLKKSIQEFRNKLIEAFEVTEDTNNDNIIEVNDKYAVVIKNTNLDIEVVELTNALKGNYPIAITYEMVDVKEENDVIYTSIDFTVNLLYENLEAANEITLEEKEAAVLNLFGYDDFEQAMLSEINNSYDPDYATLDDFLTENGLTRENLFYSFYYDTALNSSNSMTKDEFVEKAYASYIVNMGTTYPTTYLLSLVVDGKETGLSDFEVDLSEVNGVLTFNTEYFAKDTVCELIIKNTEGVVVASEQVNIRNVVDILSAEESVLWEWKSESGITFITKYKGDASEVVVPKVLDGQVMRYIDEGLFEGNTNLTSVTVKGVSILADVFAGCTNLKDVNLESVEMIGNDAFRGCTSLESITLPEEVYRICQGSFRYSGLKSIILPQKVSEIEYGAFSSCTELETVTIKGNISEIGMSAFNGCTSLSNITFEGTKISTISQYAFSNCTSLTSITLPETVNSIHSDAFGGCTNLTSIHFRGTTKPGGEPWGATNATVTVTEATE